MTGLKLSLGPACHGCHVILFVKFIELCSSKKKKKKVDAILKSISRDRNMGDGIAKKVHDV